MDSEDDSQIAQGVGDAKVQEDLWQGAGSAGCECAPRSHGHFVYRAGSGSVWGARSDRYAIVCLAKEALLRRILRLKHGIPSHDTFGRVLKALEPKSFEKAFRRFIAEFAKANLLNLTGVVAIDGKALRGAYERGRSSTPLHMVIVWAVDARIGRSLRAGRPGRNEAAGALEVLQMLAPGRLHRHRRCAALQSPICGECDRARHPLCVGAQGKSKLYEAVVRCFARAGKRSVAKQLELSTHDRRELRRATVIRTRKLAIDQDFPGIVAIARITSRRRRHGPSCRSTAETLLPALPIYPRPTIVAGRTQPLDDREPNCTGYSTSFSMRTTVGSEQAMLRRTSQPCAGLLSTSLGAIPLKPRWARK